MVVPDGASAAELQVIKRRMHFWVLNAFAGENTRQSHQQFLFRGLLAKLQDTDMPTDAEMENTRDAMCSQLLDFDEGG